MKERVATISIFANIVLAGGKLIVGTLTGSSAIFAEGLHSGMDILSSLISFIGIKIAKKPVNKKYPYGHYKFEVLSGLIITIMLFLAGLFIIVESIREFKNPSPVIVGYLSLGVMLISAIVNEIMARLKIHYGKKESSISLLSDGIHSRVDVYASLVVFAGLFLTKYWIYADSILAIFVGIYIIKESFSLGKEAVDSLLDVSAGEEVEKRIIEVVKAEKINLSELKTQKKGSVISASLEITLPNSLKIEEATQISNTLKEKLIKTVENLQYVAIQIKSHEMEIGFYKPNFGKSFNWERKGRFKNKIEEASGKGPEGDCICSACGYRVKHQKGLPCSNIQCPNCKINLKRE